ncbi:MAG: hypothetical protein GX107_00300 [Clostridiales bacterium]|jgi:vacuolar-type H+-ATPase subunit H|nr:hypothetical protein [Clostridiales bacterium]
MASEIIKKVQAAEKKSEQALLNARTAADSLIFEAENHIDEADATAKNQAEIKAGRLIDTAKGAAREKAIKAEREARELGAKMRESAEKKQSDVTKAVLEAILS